MATFDHPIRLNLEEGKAFQEKAWCHIVGMVNLKEVIDESARTRSEGIGTGCACLWNGRKLILTAKHVVEGAAPTDIAFLPRIGSALGWDSPGEISGVAERVVVGIERIIRCGWEDLAVIVLSPDGLDGLNIEFCELPKRLGVDSTVSATGSVLVVGFPVDQTFEVSETRRPGHVTKVMACPSDSFWGELVERPERPLSSRYDPDHHLLIRFEPSKPGSEPFGYSGAGVWCDPTRRGAIWTANPLLLGVQTDAYLESGLVLAIRARMIRRFLQEAL
jgi:hypothetical protein